METACHASPANTIAIVYDYDQTLSPNYMQDEVLFPAFGIDSSKFWQRCQALALRRYSELAYLKALPRLPRHGPAHKCPVAGTRRGPSIFPGLPEMFDEFCKDLARPGAHRAGESRSSTTSSAAASRRSSMARGSRRSVVMVFGCEFAEDERGPHHLPQAGHQPHAKDAVPFASTRGCSTTSRGCE